jgi:hypothetical protein
MSLGAVSLARLIGELGAAHADALACVQMSILWSLDVDVIRSGRCAGVADGWRTIPVGPGTLS